MRKKLRLDLDAIDVETLTTSAAGVDNGTVHGNVEAVPGGGTFLSWCNTCDGVSCGPACTPTKNTPDCWTRVTGGGYESCWNYHCDAVANPGLY